ncbi:molybdopterin-dependent oxidoreductase [Nocardia salmonicida]|uniref:molybdopterin-dependent oxidoreductase n=1 Tax=Nocardia salmonicida TaxID=53431 RepID=UPI003641723E
MNSPNSEQPEQHRDPSERDQDALQATGGYGFPAKLWEAIGRRRPPWLPTQRTWRSPLRGPWLTSIFGAVLLVVLPVVAVTGLLDYIAYGPQFGQANPADVGWLHLPYFDWPTRPSWLFQLTQGLHVGLGLIIIPVVLAKLWSVMPRLFTWPPVRSIAEILERLSLILLVGGIVFESATGVLNIQYDYIFGFSFYTAHYFGAWVFIAGFLIHVALKLPRMVRHLRSRSLLGVLRTSRADTRPESLGPEGLVAEDPAPATISRRGALALVGGGSLLVAILTAGQTIGGVTRHAALLVPRGRGADQGPHGFPINRTATAAGIDSAATGSAWRLTLTGGSSTRTLDRTELADMYQHTARLPIACVEGWSTTQTWTGVRLRDLAALVGVSVPSSALVTSLEVGGPFGVAALQSNQVLDPDSLLALKVNGDDLSLDHGYPARIIVPALPGVHNTKWVRSIEFRS